jgi:hypothetical protein
MKRFSLTDYYTTFCLFLLARNEKGKMEGAKIEKEENYSIKCKQRIHQTAGNGQR